MQSIESQIEKSIRRRRRGTLLMPGDFSKYGSPTAVRKALDRLEDKKIIARVAHGIYVKPKENKLIGRVLPTAEEVAKAIVKRDRMRVVPTGTYALNALGLSTQVPMNIVLLTDGSAREIKVGKRKIRFKNTTPKNLLAKGRYSSLVIQALKEIGNGKLEKEQERKILDILRQENPRNLRHDIKLAPAWIQAVMRKALTYE